MRPSSPEFELESGAATVDAEWRVMAWSPSAARFTGRASADVVGEQLWSALPALHRHAVEETLRAVFADGGTRTLLVPSRSSEGGDPLLELEVCRVDDRLLFLMRSAPVPAVEATAAEDPGTVPDAEERIWARLFEVLLAPAMLLTDDGRIVRANAAAAGLLRSSTVDALADRSLGEWIPATQFQEVFAKARVATQRLAVVLEFPDGAPAVEAQMILTATDPRRRASRLICFAVAVPRELLLQAGLSRAERLAPLGALVSGVAHRLEEPLAAIAAFATALREEAQVPLVVDQADAIHAEVAGAARVIHALLDFTRQQGSVARAVDLADVIERVCTMRNAALHQARITIGVQLDPGLRPAWGDPQLVQQILFNGVLNAEQAILSAGGPGRITIAARTCDEQVLVTVEDSGPGIPAAALERAFEPFFTTRGTPGAGLGLALSYGLVRDLGGRMWLQNVSGAGARLTLEFPVGPAPARPAPRARRLLVIDDLGARRRSTQLRAERLGHRVETAKDVEEGLERLHRRGAAYDAILVDVALGGTRTGFDLVDTLRQEGEGREREVILTAGDTISPAIAARIDTTDRPVLRTPCAIVELRELLDRLPALQPA